MRKLGVPGFPVSEKRVNGMPKTCRASCQKPGWLRSPMSPRNATGELEIEHSCANLRQIARRKGIDTVLIDVRTIIAPSKGPIFVGSLQKTPFIFLKTHGSNQIPADHFLAGFAEACLAEVQDFIHIKLMHQTPRVMGEDGLRVLRIAVPAESYCLHPRPDKIFQGKAVH